MLNFLDAREWLLSTRRQCHFPSKAVQRCRKHCHADGYESEVSKPVARLGDSGFRKDRICESIRYTISAFW